jgi:hypothetical protein
MAVQLSSTRFQPGALGPPLGASSKWRLAGQKRSGYEFSLTHCLSLARAIGGWTPSEKQFGHMGVCQGEGTLMLQLYLAALGAVVVANIIAVVAIAATTRRNLTRFRRLS